MELDLLRIDLDIPRKEDAIKHLKERLSYWHDIGFYPITMIESIVLLKKSSYGAYIKLIKPLSDEKSVVLFQSLLGSDYMKETNTLINHFMLEMEYSNRLFSVKRYKNGKIKTGKKIDITNDIIKYIYSKKRIKKNN